MKMRNLVAVLIERDGLTQEEARRQVDEAREELSCRLADGEMPFDLCEELFGLEPDYLVDLF
jgi:hypothetical protein